MKENKEEVVKQEGDKKINQKTILIIGIAVIVLLVLIIGGVFAFKLLNKDDNGGVVNNGGDKVNNNKVEQNFVVLEDGTKQNTSKGITDAEFTIEGRKFYNFKVTEKNGISTVEAKIQNITEQPLDGASFKVRLYKANKELIKEYTILTAKIQPGISTLTVTNVMEDCTNAASVEVEMVKANQVQKSGE